MCQGQESTGPPVRSGSSCFTFFIPFVYANLSYSVTGRTRHQQRHAPSLSVVIDITGRVTVKATTKVPNKPTGFSTLMSWVARHRKRRALADLPHGVDGGLPRSGRLVSSPARPTRQHPAAQQGQTLPQESAATNLKTTKSMPRVFPAWVSNSNCRFGSRFLKISMPFDS